MASKIPVFIEMDKTEKRKSGSEYQNMAYTFQFDQTDEVFQSYPLLCPHYTTKQADQQLPSPTEDATHLCTDKPSSFAHFRRRRRKSSLAFNENDNSATEFNKSKVLHRDTERQRRQEMASLYASLRSQIPLEYLKGKRSISDHMQEAVNYIKELQDKIEELCNKRERVQKLCKPFSSSSSNVGMGYSRGATGDVVTVRPSRVGIEILINTSLEEGLPLSTVLQVVIREGLSVVSCTSTKVNERIFHTIESEQVKEGRIIDLSELQQILTSLIS